MDCITCDMYGQFDSLALSYAREAYEGLIGPAETLFGTVIGLWFVFQIIRMFLGDFQWRDFAVSALLIFLVVALYQMSGTYWDWVYNPLRDTTYNLTAYMVSREATGITGDSVRDLIMTMETQMREIYDAAAYMIDESSVWNIAPLFWGFLLLIPFTLVVFIFLAYMIEGGFKLMAMTAIAPVLFLFIPFKGWRWPVVSACRIALGGMLTILFAGIAMGFTVHIIDQFLAFMPLSGDGYNATEAEEFPGSMEYISLIGLGLISILFHLKAATLASNIAGALDGPGAAATVAGLGTAMGTGGAALATRQSRRAAGAAGGAHLRDRFKAHHVGGSSGTQGE